MTTDSHSKEQDPRSSFSRKLPDIIKVAIRYIDNPFPKRRFIRSAFADVERVVEILVSYEGDYPSSAAVAPVLYVGDTMVVESELLEGNRVRFLAHDIKRLVTGAPIRLGWPNEQPTQLAEKAQDEEEVKYFFHLDDK